MEKTTRGLTADRSSLHRGSPRTFGRDLIDSVLVATAKVQSRIRLLPSRVMIYYILALSLYPQDSYEEVMRDLSEADQFSSSWSVPSKVAIFKARLRLGAEPMRRLYETVAKPLAPPGDEGAFYRGLRLVAIDGTSLSVADSAENLAHFARPTTSLGQTAYAKARVVGLLAQYPQPRDQLL